jgi:hypothetical protein
MDDPDPIERRCSFHWWPHDIKPSTFH